MTLLLTSRQLPPHAPLVGRVDRTVLLLAAWTNLRLVGRVGKAVGVPVDGVDLAGSVEGLATEYAAADVVINSAEAGSGLEIKAVDALCRSNVVVASSNGLDGFASAEPAAFIVAEYWLAFAKTVVRLLCDPLSRIALQEVALKCARPPAGPRSVACSALQKRRVSPMTRRSRSDGIPSACHFRRVKRSCRVSFGIWQGHRCCAHPPLAFVAQKSNRA